MIWFPTPDGHTSIFFGGCIYNCKSNAVNFEMQVKSILLCCLDIGVQEELLWICKINYNKILLRKHLIQITPIEPNSLPSKKMGEIKIQNICKLLLFYTCFVFSLLWVWAMIFFFLHEKYRKKRGQDELFFSTRVNKKVPFRTFVSLMQCN